MRLAGFLIKNIEPTLQEWENFACSFYGLLALDPEGLPDHAKLMQRAIAADLQMRQSTEQQVKKSKGLSGTNEGTAAKTHATMRRMAGFH